MNLILKNENQIFTHVKTNVGLVSQIPLGISWAS
jgi:hypothetical protein